MKPFDMVLPRNLAEASGASRTSFKESKMLAGGTDLLGELKEETQTPKRLINLKTLTDLNGIRVESDGLSLGALTSLARIADHPEIVENYPALRTTILKTATPQLRNVGTLGGNLCQRVRCWYYRDATYPCRKKGGALCYAQRGENEYHSIFDNQVCCAPHPSNTAPVLIAYDAEVEISGKSGSRRIPLEDFFVGPETNVQAENVLEPDEVLTRVFLKRSTASRPTAYIEAREKQSFDWALCGATVSLRFDAKKVADARIVLSAVAPTPKRRRDLEKMLIGKELTDKLLTEVAQRAVWSATPLEHNEYKLTLVKTTLKRALNEVRKG